MRMIQEIENALKFFGPLNQSQIKEKLLMRDIVVNDKGLAHDLDLMLKRTNIVLAYGFQETTYKIYGGSK